MSLFAISDLHLSGAVPTKAMDIFGTRWQNHAEKIADSWRKKVSPADTVLIPGDISWGMTMEEALPDLAFIASLPGKKILLKGNHDYWWSSIGRLRRSIEPDMQAIQNDCIPLEDCIIAGTRGWLCPGSANAGPEDLKLYRREVIRLELSLTQAEKLSRQTGLPIIAMMHFPPINEKLEDSDFTALLKQYSVKTLVYGHLHGPGIRSGFTGERDGIRYHLTSCDAIDFSPVSIDL